jgi:hypothetical protein
VSLLIYNSATAGSGATAVTPGYYYYDGGAWVRMLKNGDVNSISEADDYGNGFLYSSQHYIYNSGSPISMSSIYTKYLSRTFSFEIFNNTTYSANNGINPDAAQIISDSINSLWNEQGFTNSFCFTSIRKSGTAFYISLYAFNPPADVNLYFTGDNASVSFNQTPYITSYTIQQSSVNSSTQNISSFNNIADINFHTTATNPDNVDVSWVNIETLKTINLSGLGTSVKDEVLDQLISFGAINGKKLINGSSGGNATKISTLEGFGWTVY